MQYLTRSELRLLAKVTHQKNALHHTMILTGFWHGLRVSELVSLTAGQVINGQLSVKRLKRSNATLQPIHRDADPLFDNSGLIELARSKAPGERLFPMTRQYADRLMKHYCDLVGISKEKAHTHVLKHSIAMALFDATNGSVGMVQSYLGHKSASSTLVYLYEADARKAQAVVAGIAI